MKDQEADARITEWLAEKVRKELRLLRECERVKEERTTMQEAELRRDE